MMTGKETTPITSPIEEIWITESLDSEEPVVPVIRNKIKDRIAEADLICYPPGSFYSSVVANLLPEGVGKAVAANSCPKVFVPSTGTDPEACELSVSKQIKILKAHLVKSGAPENSKNLDLVILDSRNGQYAGGINLQGIRKQGIEVVDYDLVAKGSSPYLDEQRLSEVLASLA
jgi:2-phospho-L-lactate transferase/gluconeogenesis factor (CofD/UPF0052 family)